MTGHRPALLAHPGPHGTVVLVLIVLVLSLILARTL
jgi:hypothetical protein